MLSLIFANVYTIEIWVNMLLISNNIKLIGGYIVKAKVVKAVKGVPAVDGAGVSLTRVLGRGTIEDFDPILMLDSFDSTNPEDYLAGFPTHPHRGIETVTYLASGRMDHKDSMGNEGSILDGDVQWMTAGSGIMHSEYPKESKRMLGLQFWLNLPSTEKMDDPKYFDIKGEDMPSITEDGATYKVISGKFKDAEGVKPHHIQAKFVEVKLEPHVKFEIPLEEFENHFIFNLQGGVKIEDKVYTEKTAVLIGEGNYIEIESTDEPLHIIFVEAPRLNEPVA